MFTRTKEGLSSEHLFHKVEAVVYCEGKECSDDASSLDEVFWEHIFSQNGKHIKCKSIGSKSNLRLLAQIIIHGKVSNIIVAMDRDYDDYFGKAIDYPNIIYTYGYSWESDVMLDFQFRSALSLFVTTTNRKSILDDFVVFRTKLSSRLRRIFALDFKYIGCEGKLFDRGKPMSIIATPGNAEPHVKISELLKNAKALGRYQTAPLPDAIYRTVCGVQSFFGKVVSRLIFHWFLYRTKRIAGSRKVHYEAFMNLLLNTLNITEENIDRNKYYSDNIAKIK